MPTTWIEVVDSAVKIGLGAAISGVATYIVSTKSHKHGVQKDLLTRRVTILESAAALAEDYFYFCTRLNNAVGGILKKADNAGAKQTDAQRQRIKEVDSGLSKALESRNQALSKLELLGLKEAASSLVEYNRTLGSYRDIVIFEARLPTEAERTEMSFAFQQHKSAFHAALSSYFSSL